MSMLKHNFLTNQKPTNGLDTRTLNIDQVQLMRETTATLKTVGERCSFGNYSDGSIQLNSLDLSSLFLVLGSLRQI